MRERARSRRAARRFAALVLALAAALYGAPLVTRATAAPTPPTVHCAWALADANVATPEFDYGAVDRPHASAPPSACTYDTVLKQARQPANSSVLQIARESTTPRAIELWAAVSDPASDAFATGAGEVRWEVVGPQGGPPTTVLPTARTCAGTTEPGLMWQWSSTEPNGTRALSATAVTNADRRGLWERCRQGALRVFSGHLDLAMNARACGVHTVNTIATVGTLRDEKRFTINVLCPVDVVLDTTQIAWAVEVGSSSSVAGDLDPASKYAPTLTNRGTRPAQIGLLFTAMTRSDNPTKVVRFSAEVQTATGAPTKAERFVAGDRVWLDHDGFILCPGESARLTLTLHASAQVVDGTYTGRVSILAREGGQC
jgi:hypothetical protein